MIQRSYRWARRKVGRFGSRFAWRGLILLYHRVAEVESDPWSLCVSPGHFAEQLAVLRDSGRATTLQALADAESRRTLGRGAVTVTFDDGYADNLYAAKPLLERFDVPATCFLVRGPAEISNGFWWDELEQVILRPRVLPERLHLEIDGTPLDYELADDACWGEHDWNRFRNWRALEQNPPTQRHALYSVVYERCKSLSAGPRRALLDMLGRWAGIQPESRHAGRLLCTEEIVRLREGSLIEIGAHTATHPFLSRVSPSDQWKEITRSKATLEEVIDAPVTSFAYPHGDFSGQTLKLVRAAGYERACSTSAAAVRRSSDLYQLPRFAVGDWDGEEFARRLKEWLVT